MRVAHRLFLIKTITWLCLTMPAMVNCAALNAQNRLAFNHLTVENGLSSGSVISLTQDHQGFLWAGTMDGLNRYDGKRVKIFKSFYANNPIGVGVKVAQLLADDQQNLWIGTQKGLYVYNTRLDSFRFFFHSDQDPGSICDNSIKALFMDKQGTIWIGTQHGLCRINPGQGFRFQQIPLVFQNDSLSYVDVHAVSQNSSGNILVGTANGMVTLTEQVQGTKKNYSLAIALRGVNVSTIAEDKTQTIWIGANGTGLYKMNKNGVVEKQYQEGDQKNGLVSNIIRKIKLDKKGRLWIGTLKGLNLFDLATEHFETYVHDPEDESSLNFNSIFDIFEDRQGTMWIATYFGGLNFSEALRTPFTVYKNRQNESGISSNVIQPVIGDEQNNLWIGTEAEGLNYFDRQKRIFKWYLSDALNKTSLSSNLVKALTWDKDHRIWVGMHNGGVNVIDHTGKKLFQFNSTTPDALNSNDVTALLTDDKKRIWIGTLENGINIYDPETGKLEKFESVYPGKDVASRGITCLFEDSERNIWIGTSHGLSVLQVADNRMLTFYRKNAQDQLQSDIINCITEDKQGVIWIGTYAGLSSYNPVQKKFNTFTVKEGLAGNKAVAIVLDNNDNLWISTNNGISRFNAARTQFHSFNVYDGLPGNVFNYRSAFKDKTGHIFFGGYNGLVEFVPEEMEINTVPPEVILTGLRINSNSIHPKDSSELLTKDISATTAIDLKYNQSTLTVDYAVMNFIKPAKNRSAYKLEGLGMDWVYTDTHTASFINIPPGDYVLLVKACNNDGVWSTTREMLQISILPPPWKSWWAYTLYVIGILALSSGVIYFFASRAAMKRKLRYEQMLNVKQQELHRMKMDFFTHISHEIRTPLTLILGPVEMLMNIVPANSTGQKLLHTIKNNAERLLKLTTDLLDFRKADAGYTQLKITAGNIVHFCAAIYDKFTGAAAKKNIEFAFKGGEKKIEVYFDPHYLEIVLSNLLSNAIKFTPAGGKIEMYVEQKNNEAVEIGVCDNGVGIAPECQDKIFSSFYQANTGKVKNTGSGIGLAFSKNLVELHRGKLSFTSKENSGTGVRETCFTVTLKLGKSHFNDSSVLVEQQPS